MRGECGGSPDDQGEEAKEGNIRVTVSHRLGADLHDSNDGNEGAEKP